MATVKQAKSTGRSIAIKVSLIVTLFSLVGLALPYGLVLFLSIVGARLPNGKYLDYEGLTARQSGVEIYTLNIDPNKCREIFVLIGKSPKRLRDIEEEDLVQLGFVKDRFGYMKRSNPIYSRAKIDDHGFLTVMNLRHVEGARVPFSASPDGPFLELPVSREEFEKQFGKPLSTRYSYPNPNDPR